jgi:energy-coupling factor transporter ATP-binding protein EcfA2
MIILERLSITRFKGVRAVVLDLPERGAILIEGNNEAGKSTLFESIHFAMYGRTLTGTLADAVPHDADDAEVSLRLRIERAGKSPDSLDITRTITSGGTQASSGVRLRVVRGGTEAEEVRRVGDANRRIAQELGGLTADTFVNSCFVPQKQLAGLETLDRSQREAAVASLLNLDRLTRAAQAFAVRATDTEELRRHEARVALAEGTEARASIEARRILAEANVQRLNVLETLATVEAASRRAREAAVDAIKAIAQRDRATAVVNRHALLVEASTAWMAVEDAVRQANDARTASRSSLARQREATAAQTAVPDADARLERLRGIEAHLASVTSWMIEERPALRQAVAVIDARRLARIRANADLQAAEVELRDLDSQLRVVEARREALHPTIASRDAARARRVAIDTLRDAVFRREARRREATEADVAVNARVDADERLALARERLAVASARVVLLDRDRDAVAHRDQLLRIRTTLAAAIDAREAHAQARARNERLRDLTLGVVEASPSPSGHLDLQVHIDHPLTGARIVDLRLDADGGVSASSREATDDETRRARHGEIPTLTPADLDVLDADARRARDALMLLGEARPSTTRAARDRLAELDAILAQPITFFDTGAHSVATTAREQAAAETHVHQRAVDSMETPTALARRAADAHAAATAASDVVAQSALELGLTVPEEAPSALQVIDAARREVDDALEATAVAAGAIEAAEREAIRLEDLRIPATARADAARRDLARDDDDTLNRQEETARTAGRAGDHDAVAQWQGAHAEARALGIDVPDSADAELPMREAITNLVEIVSRASRVASDEVTRLRARAGDVRSASDDAKLDAERVRRAIDALNRAIAQAREFASRAVESGTAEADSRLVEVIHQASTAANRFAYAQAPKASEDLPTEGIAAQIADGFAAASRFTGVDEARRALTDATDAERDADRAGAAARADADTAWRVTIEAARSFGLEIGDRPDDPEPVIARLREAAALTDGPELDRATALATWRAVLAEAGTVTETIAGARRAIGDEDPLPVSEARTRRDIARLDLRARERAVAILTATRARMMAAILPDTQREMSRILPDLTAGRYQFPRLDDRFQLEVYDGRKRGWIRRSLFSGGTQDQFSLALRLGFAIAALPRELGTAPGFLFLDEPLSSFDRERTRALVDLLRDPTGIVGTHFRQIFLISHSQAFDPGLFPYQIVMDEGRVARTTLPTTAAIGPMEARSAEGGAWENRGGGRL